MWALRKDKPFVNQAVCRGRGAQYMETDGEEEEGKEREGKGITLGGGSANKWGGAGGRSQVSLDGEN